MAEIITRVSFVFFSITEKLPSPQQAEIKRLLKPTKRMQSRHHTFGWWRTTKMYLHHQKMIHIVCAQHSEGMTSLLQTTADNENKRVHILPRAALGAKRRNTYKTEEGVFDDQSRELVLVPGNNINRHCASNRLPVCDQLCL